LNLNLIKYQLILYHCIFKCIESSICTFINSDIIYFAGNRIEDFFYEKIDKRRPNRLSNLEYVGADMIEAGNDFGPGIAYG